MSRYTFNPPEEELINNYLNNKILGRDDLVESEINEVHICGHEPPELPGLAKIASTNTWYFFSPVEKLGRSNRKKRATRTGHWKITGKSRLVKNIEGVPVGLKKFLVFQENNGSSSATPHHKTNWIIHEFHSFIPHPNKEVYVLCKLMRKAAGGMSSGPDDPLPGTDRSLSVSSDHVLTQLQEATPNSVQDNGGGFDYDYNFEERHPKIHGPPRDLIAVSEHNNNNQIQKLGELIGSSSCKNTSQIGHGYGQNTVDVAKSWEQGESISLMMASDTTSEANNYSIQETGELADRCYMNMPQYGHVYGQNAVDISKPSEPSEYASSLVVSDAVSEANNYKIQKSGEPTNMPQIGHVDEQNTSDLLKSWESNEYFTSLVVSDMVSEANTNSQVQDLWWWRSIQENHQFDGPDTWTDDISLWSYQI